MSAERRGGKEMCGKEGEEKEEEGEKPGDSGVRKGGGGKREADEDGGEERAGAKELRDSCEGAVEMRGKDGREGEGDEERESGEEGSKKGGKAEVEEKKVVQKEAMGRVPGVVLKEIRGKR